ncbi:hypothetical protein DL93DRAFT_2174155 [Clavulina sp. PMI_390]|nr:hypothetical protein DL93DRAFT_2174155 [Clavulina sp. PMI_390]
MRPPLRRAKWQGEDQLNHCCRYLNFPQYFRQRTNTDGFYRNSLESSAAWSASVAPPAASSQDSRAMPPGDIPAGAAIQKVGYANGQVVWSSGGGRRRPLGYQRFIWCPKRSPFWRRYNAAALPQTSSNGVQGKQRQDNEFFPRHALTFVQRPRFFYSSAGEIENLIESISLGSYAGSFNVVPRAQLEPPLPSLPSPRLQPRTAPAAGGYRPL